jgi:hypothetical protein
VKQISDMVLYTPLYEADGDSFSSRDAYGHPCTAACALWRPGGREFTGANGIINCGSAMSLDNLGRVAPYCFSIAAWIKPASIGQTYGRVAYKNKIDLVLASAQTISFAVTAATVPKNVKAADNTVPYGVWSFVAGIYNGTNVLVSVNNTIWTGAAVTGAIDDHSSNDFIIGNNSGNNRCFDGLIGEVMGYNRALTPQEIKRIYLETKWRYQ